MRPGGPRGRLGVLRQGKIGVEGPSGYNRAVAVLVPGSGQLFWSIGRQRGSNVPTGRYQASSPSMTQPWYSPRMAEQFSEAFVTDAKLILNSEGQVLEFHGFWRAALMQPGVHEAIQSRVGSASFVLVNVLEAGFNTPAKRALSSSFGELLLLTDFVQSREQLSAKILAPGIALATHATAAFAASVSLMNLGLLDYRPSKHRICIGTHCFDLHVRQDPDTSLWSGSVEPA